MWWYRDRETEGATQPDESSAHTKALAASLRSCELGDDALRGACVAMAVLVDHEFEWDDEQPTFRPSRQHAEALVQQAFASHDLSRLYNDFARDFDDGFTGRDDLSDADRDLVEALLEALRATEGLARLQRRPPPTAEVAP